MIPAFFGLISQTIVHFAVHCDKDITRVLPIKHVYIPRQNIWDKIEKYRKIGQNKA